MVFQKLSQMIIVSNDACVLYKRPAIKDFPPDHNPEHNVYRCDSGVKRCATAKEVAITHLRRKKKRKKKNRRMCGTRVTTLFSVDRAINTSAISKREHAESH